MITLTTRDAIRRYCDTARATGKSVGFVATMGFFHEGHLSLMRAARSEHDVVVVSIFVNPLQFAPTEDLGAYPRDLERDLDLAAAEGVDVVFAPTPAEMYPEPVHTNVHVAELGDGLCGSSRPGHFDGVSTVVAKLFSLVGPSTAYFGRKDAQQLAIVRRMTRDLELPVTVVGCPLVREADGLAMSSRNAYLSEGDRAAAAVLSRALFDAAARVGAGERDADAVRGALRTAIATEPAVALDYAEVCDAVSLQPVRVIDGEVLVAVAARVGAARLIDNCTLFVHDTEVDADLGVTTIPAESEA
ncbi:MAG: pantoate--beta-alanine ligase [Acidimicrobiia bacterium]